MDGDKYRMTDLHPSYRLRLVGNTLVDELRTSPLAWNSDWDRPGQRDTGYWLLGVALKNAGCDAGEIADRLDHAARFSMSRERGKLRGSVKRIIKKLSV